MKHQVKSTLHLLMVVAMFLNYSGFSYAADLPQVAGIVAGTVGFDTHGSTMNITASDKSIINYSQFNIAANHTVNFIQPSSTAVALNRVTGSQASSIYGALNANGRIFLVNPNGILFGAGSQVNVGGLIASTMGISNSDFLSGKYSFNRNGAKGAVDNQGQITIRNGGYLALLAPEVRNSGSIVANLGSVILASGEAATVKLDDKGDLSVVIDQALKTKLSGQVSGVTNSGTIKADGGKITLTAQALNSLLDNAINNTGVIQANTLSGKNGEIYLTANGKVSVGGTIKAVGGKVQVSSEGAAYYGILNAANAVFNANGGDTSISGISYTGNQTWVDALNIFVTGNLTVTGGYISITAGGNFTQDLGTTIMGDNNVTIKGVNVTIGNIITTGNVQVDATGGDVTHTYGSTVQTAGGNFRGNASRDYILETGASVNTGSGTIDILAGRDIVLGTSLEVYLFNWSIVPGSRGYKFTEFGYYVNEGGVITRHTISTGVDIGKVAPFSGSGSFVLDSGDPLLLYGFFSETSGSTPFAVYQEAALNSDNMVHVKPYTGAGCETSSSCYGFEDKVGSDSDYDYNDAVIDLTLNKLSGATLNSTGNVFLTAITGGIDQTGGNVIANNLMTNTYTGMEGVGSNGGLLVTANHLSAYNRGPADIAFENQKTLSIEDLLGVTGLNTGVTGSTGIENLGYGSTIDLISQGDLLVNAPVTGHGDIYLTADGDIVQSAQGRVLISQYDGSLFHEPTNVQATDGHDTGVWQSGISNDNTIDVQWQLPESWELYSFIAVAGGAFTQQEGAAVYTNGGAAKITATGDVTLTLINAGNGAATITSKEGSIIDGDLGHVTDDYDVIANTIKLKAAGSIGSDAEDGEIDIGAPDILFSYSWTHGPATPDGTPGSYDQTLNSEGQWVFSTTSLELEDAADWYFNVTTANYADPSIGPFFIDTTPPEITRTSTGTENPDGTWLPDVKVRFDATDNLSGFGEDFENPVASGTTKGPGTYEFSGSICDLAGNCASNDAKYTVALPPSLQTGLLLSQKFIYPHAERLGEKLVNPMDMITSAGLMITGQVFFYHPLAKVDDGSYNGFQLEQGAYDFIDGQISPCDASGKGANPCKGNK